MHLVKLVDVLTLSIVLVKNLKMLHSMILGQEMKLLLYLHGGDLRASLLIIRMNMQGYFLV